MTLELMCMNLIGLLLGAAIAFGGYRFFLFLLPIWGFFFGFGLGAQTMQAVFGEAFLSTVTSWVVGLVVGIVFAVLSYFFYLAAVAIVAGGLGYALGYGLLAAIGMTGLVGWIVGIVAAVALIMVTFRFNIQKYVIILATAIGGAAAMVAVLRLGVERVELAQLAEQPLRALLSGAPILTILFLVLAVAGAAIQIQANRRFEIEAYNRWEEMEAM